MSNADSIVREIATELALDLIAKGDIPTDFHDIATAYVESNEMETRIESLTLNERLDEFETAKFNPDDWLMPHPMTGNQVVTQMLHGMYVTSIRTQLQEYESEIEIAVTIHNALDRVADEVYLINGAPNYTEVVHDFFTWIGMESSRGNPKYDTLSLSEVNEMHVRGLTPLDFQNELLIEALHEWLSAEYTEYIN